MPTIYRPDVYIQESASSSFAPTAAVSTTFVFAGAHMQGPTTPTLVQSWGQFLKQFGGFGPGSPTYLSLAVYAFFISGGGQCQVLRVTGTSAATATLNVLDSQPEPTITVNAASPGVWGNSVYVAILAETDGVSADFTLVVYSGGTASSNVVETWQNVSMTPWSPRYFVSMINNPNAGSAYIRVVDVQGTTTVAGHTPAVLSATVLASGNDGSAPTDSQITAALPSLNGLVGPITLNLPGNSDSSAVAGAISYAENRPIPMDTFVIIDPPASQTPAEITGASAAGLVGSGGYVQDFGGNQVSAIYYPWLLISDPTSSTPGAVRYLPPGGFVAGAYSYNDSVAGVWKAPAGVRTGSIPAASGLQYNLTPADLDNLNYNNVNAITLVPRNGITIMGARTLSALTSQRYINVRRLMSFIEVTVQQTLLAAIWEPNDAILWGQVSVTVDTFLGGLFAAGAFAGTTAATSYFVTCDGTVNTPTTIAQGQLICVVGVAPVTPAEFILFQISQWANGSTTVTTS